MPIVCKFDMMRRRSCLFLSIVAVNIVCEAKTGLAFAPVIIRKTLRPAMKMYSQFNGNQEQATAAVVGYVSDEERPTLEQALLTAGFIVDSQSADNHHEYAFSRATGMLKLQSKPTSLPTGGAPPQWIPLVKNMENILVANGWSFLDPDENEDMSAFNIDAANLEGQYKPCWGISSETIDTWSKLGFSLQRLSANEVESEARHTTDWTRQVLLEGATDPPYVKQTHNGHSFAGSVQNLTPGIFVCVVGGLPLFTTQHLSPSTASSGWLSFSQPVSDDHIQLIHPDANSPDQRVEVVCAKSGCHLGHYFGKGNGYCINASVLNFVQATGMSSTDLKILSPQSWFALEESTLLHATLKRLTRTEHVVLGAGCFWHVEFALRRVPGVVSTQVGYAGGSTPQPTYEQVCASHTGYAEVVQVEFDPKVLEPRMLFDSFLALHDPTKVRAHGKHAQGIGQYRSCIFVSNDDLKASANAALDDCRLQLNKELSTELCDATNFWPAEERHQRHDERRNPTVDRSTLPVTEWLKVYGKRSQTILGSAATLSSLTGM